MVELQINTTQNVNINFIAATVGERILAYIVDWIIKIAYIVVIYQLVFRLFNIDRMLIGMDTWSIIAIYLCFYLPVIFYSLILEVLMDGQTIGKRILKIKVVKIDGYQASLADFVTRWFFRIVDLNLFGPIFGPIVALLSIIFNSKNQRLGDITAGTAVITLKHNVHIKHTILEDLGKSYTPVYPSVIKLSDRDARIIKDTFMTARKSKDYKTLIKLREKIVQVIEIKEKQHSNDIDFITCILKDYNYYTQNM